jgi:hypothetical protein
MFGLFFNQVAPDLLGRVYENFRRIAVEEFLDALAVGLR